MYPGSSSSTNPYQQRPQQQQQQQQQYQSYTPSPPPQYLQQQQVHQSAPAYVPFPYPPQNAPGPGNYVQYQQQQPPPPGFYQSQNFAPSSLRGKHKSLLIGINYRGQRSELRGCINDVMNMKQFAASYGYPNDVESQLILTEDQRHPSLRPTRQNMIAAFQWLVMGAQPGDALLLHYSGHGGQQKNTQGTELDGYDGTLYPLDHAAAGIILDDELHHILVKPLPSGVRLTAIFDCCMSGTMLDLPYTYNHDGTLKVYNPLKAAAQSAFEDVKGGRGLQGVFKGVQSLMNSTFDSNKEETIRQRYTALADVIMFSGCKDAQTSADANIAGFGAIGAMSHALITCLQRQRNMSYIMLLQQMRATLIHGNFQQKPQLSTGRPMDMNWEFTL